jgi:hypothetical protein
MKGLRALLVLVLVGAAGAGCITIERGHFEALSTAPLPGTPRIVAEEVEGRACGSVFQDPLRRAIEDALRNAPGANALMDVRHRFRDLCVVVSGRAVAIP